MIYKVVLIKFHKIRPDNDLSQEIYGGRTGQASRIDLSSLSLCKLAYQESYPIFCAHNSFQSQISCTCLMRTITTSQDFFCEVRELAIDWEIFVFIGPRSFLKPSRTLTSSMFAAPPTGERITPFYAQAL